MRFPLHGSSWHTCLHHTFRKAELDSRSPIGLQVRWPSFRVPGCTYKLVILPSIKAAAVMPQSYDDLFEALLKDDLESFRSQLLTYGWPKNLEWPDHHLLSEAIKFGRKEVAKYLLDLECRVAKPGNHSTLVHVALMYSDWTDVVVKLTKLGAPVSTVNAAGDTAVHIAFKRNVDGELLDLLLLNYVRESIMNIKNAGGLSVLHIACSRPGLEVVEDLTYRNTRVIVTREDVNGQVQCSHSKDYSHYTPLHFAVKNGHTEIVKFLSQHFPVDVYKVDSKSSTPIHLALDRRDIEMLDCLLAYDKLHEDVVNNTGLSHFMAACAGSNMSIAAEYLRLTQHRPWTSPKSLIINKVTDSDESPYSGYSALHFAAEFGRLDTVQLLLAHGASCFVASAENLTPLVVAVKRGHENVYRLLWRWYKAYRQTLYDAIDEEDRRRAASVGSGSVEVKNQVSSRSPVSNGERKGFVELKSQGSSSPLDFSFQKIPASVSNDSTSPRSLSPSLLNGQMSPTSPKCELVRKKGGW